MPPSEPLSEGPDGPSAAYVHIPFCRRRCFYCDFPISVIGNRLRGETSGTISTYVGWLCGEIRATSPLGPALRTVFFGGGTPSLLSVPQLEQILHTLEQQFGFAEAIEISMEMDPGTFDLAHVQGYCALGVNRISLGVQAFDDGLLERCGRFHRLVDVHRAVDDMHRSGVPSWSLDLISGLPHQTLAQWQGSLASAIATQPHHLSIYDLTIEPQTPFGKQYQPGETPLPTEATTVDMYRLAQQMLTTAGYDHYEISNYAKPGHQCRHNRTYWENRPFYGFGLGATSYTQAQRVARPRTQQTYRQWVEQYQQANGVLDEPKLPPMEQLTDHLMVGLRLAEGIDLGPFTQIWGDRFTTMLHQCLRPYLPQGHVVLENNRLRLSDPDGFLISNAVLADLFHGLEQIAGDQISGN
ncbi:radical SAM family heme chaperone HemW [Leptothoe sp. PORK10 BA2]|uniref:radical SAM family heme chaperone HemW n=1 Tax=Leptothoe sp. PORK10 BA2 TaxID=3110254 RepID=UPI002B1FB552|nr:radical SAM family heme chaperone HemW [Leptothoe sp. PORK10 BA2]MEA5466558.1 radical SAM family heme chaperone HemW [Leptothoe sp. PORK10 BA2]